MALQRTRLQEVVQVPSSVGSVYANPSGAKTFLKGLIVHNTNTSSETVLIHWVPDSTGTLGTAADSNRLFKLSVTSGETIILEIPFSLVLTDTNESIQAVTNTASKVTLVLCGDIDV